jgi:hypothetical protein
MCRPGGHHALETPNERTARLWQLGLLEVTSRIDQTLLLRRAGMDAAIMTSREPEPVPVLQDADPARKGLYRLGGYAALTALVVILIEGLVIIIIEAV